MARRSPHPVLRLWPRTVLGERVRTSRGRCMDWGSTSRQDVGHWGRFDPVPDIHRAGGIDAIAEPKPETPRIHHLCHPGRVSAVARVTTRMANDPGSTVDAPRRCQAHQEGQTKTHDERSRTARLLRADRGPTTIRTDRDLTGIPRVRAQTT